MQKVQLVGILNITPDSFSQDGIYDDADHAIQQAHKLFNDGAQLLDVGAEATNPWAKPITAATEWQRLRTILAKLLPAYPDKISIDTHHSDTVERIVKEFGKHFIINDVTGMNDRKMRDVVARYDLRCIVSHLPARFDTNIKAAHSDASMNTVSEVLNELLVRRSQLIDAGLDSDSIILDPGIGFGKTAELNSQLLRFTDYVRQAGVSNQVMIGYSRKRFLGENRFAIEPNLAAGKIAIESGASYIRVHDVLAHYRLLP